MAPRSTPKSARQSTGDISRRKLEIVRSLADLARLPPERRGNSAAQGARAGERGARREAERQRARRVPARVSPSGRARASSSCVSPRRCCAFRMRETADRLISDKIPSGDWEDHLGRQRLAVRECLDLGPDAHGSHRRCGSRGDGLGALVVRPADEPPRRAGCAHGAAPGDAHSRPSSS